MSSAHAKSASSDVGSSSAFVCVLTWLDPRRWFGALLAVLGVLISIVAPLLPISFLKRVYQPAAGEPPHRSLHVPKRPSPSPVQPSAITTATARRPSARPRTAGDPPFSPHVSFTFGPHPRSVSTGSLVGSLRSTDPSPQLKSCLLPAHVDVKNPSPFSSPSPSVTSLPPASPYYHPHALPSLDSLDLASDTSAPTSQQSHAQSAKRPFRIQIPKLGFGKRRSATDLKAPGEITAPPAAGEAPGLASPPLDKEQSTKGNDKEEWRGTKAFAVKRSNTIATSPVTATEPATPQPLTPRRRFSLFSREPSSSKEKDPPPIPTVPSHTQPITPPANASTIPPVPSLPSPATLERMVASIPSVHLTPNAAAGPSSTSPSSSPPTSRVVSLALEDMIPLSQTTTPPARPARTDPYKSHGVPVPGSERARAFLKAEKQWIRAEKEKREREKAERVGGGARAEEEDGEAEADGETERERCKDKLQKCPVASLKKRKDSVLVAVEAAAEEHAQEVDAGAEADMEDEKTPADPGATHLPDEFGVLPVVDVTPPVEQTPTQQKRSWGFSRRSSDIARDRDKEKEKEEKRREKEKRSKEKEKEKEEEKDKEKDADPVKAKKRPKSRDGSKKSKGFRSKGGGSAKGKDRGYASDTGVPSLTYKLMA